MQQPPPSPYVYGQYPQPPQPPKKKRRIWPWIIGGTLLLCSCAFFAPSMFASSSGIAQPIQAKPTDTPTTSSSHHVVIMQSSPTPTVTPIKPTVIPTQPPVSRVSGPPLLGSPIGTFIAKYGQPDAHSNVSTGQYHFQKYADSNIDFLIVSTGIPDAKSQLVYSISVQADESGWSTTTANSFCTSFLPGDAIYKSETTLTSTTGYDKIYYSASLANTFPASAFTDANNNQAQAGLFDVQYLINPDNTVNSCTLLIGTEQTQ